MKFSRVVVLSLFPLASSASDNDEVSAAPVARTKDPSLFKRVRELVKPEGRDLEEDVSRLQCFWECVNQGMTAEECEVYITELLGGPGLPGHVIPNLSIKINRPRPGPWLDKTFWMIGIPTNIYGEADCDINNGVISYPWTWTVNGNDYTIPDTDCLGLSANDCCDAILANIAADPQGIPLSDENGNCLSCWVHQELLEPYIPCEGDEGDLVYLEHQASGGVCTEIELTEAEVNAADDAVQASLDNALVELQSVITAGSALCSDFEALWKDLLFYGRSFPRAMSRIPQLLCEQCDDPASTLFFNTEMKKDLKWIKKELEGEIDSVQNCIVIYTDRQGYVMEPPKIGGSRAELDFDRDDPKCDEDGCPPTDDDCAELGQILVNGVCVPCPAGTFFNANLTPPGCEPEGVVCPGNQQDYNGDGQCECAPGTELVGELCVSPCPEGQVRNDAGDCECPGDLELSEDDTCECPGDLLEIEGDSCVCPPGQVSQGSSSCGCPGDLELSEGGICECLGDLVETGANMCECPGELVQDDFSCVCPGDLQATEGDTCECPGGLVDIGGGVCGCPIPGQQPNSSGVCACTFGYALNPAGNACVPEGNACPDGTTYNPTTKECEATCGCGFCPTRAARTPGWEACCEINGGGNNCKPPGGNSSNDGCNFGPKTFFYPGYSDQQGNVCSGVEIKNGAVVNVGCGCKPSATAPCTYDPTAPETCFICSVEDMADSSAIAADECYGCRQCLKSKCASVWAPRADCVALLNGSTGTAAQWAACLSYDATGSRRALRSNAQLAEDIPRGRDSEDPSKGRILKGAPVAPPNCALDCAQYCKYGDVYGP